MKLFAILFVLLVYSCAVDAQLTNNTVNATLVDLKDLNNNVIGKMPIIPGLKRDIFLRNVQALS
jgi:hypothetical protein